MPNDAELWNYIHRLDKQMIAAGYPVKPSKARLFQVKSGVHKGMWCFDCPCEPRPWRYWHYGAAYGTMLWHFHLYHRRPHG